jgi:hypothetical protein
MRYRTFRATFEGSSQYRDDGEYPLHNVHSPLVQMSESMLEIIHFL